MGFRLLPREDEYFTLFSQITEKIQEASTALVDMMHDNNANFEAHSRRIKDAEHACDELIEMMIDNPSATTGAAHLLFVAKHLERIGDYVKDICELNVYLREAVFIKHGAND